MTTRILIPGKSVADLQPYVEGQLIERLTAQGVRFAHGRAAAALARALTKGAQSITSFSGGTKYSSTDGVLYVLDTVVRRGAAQIFFGPTMYHARRQLALRPTDGSVEMTVGKDAAAGLSLNLRFSSWGKRVVVAFVAGAAMLCLFMIAVAGWLFVPVFLVLFPLLFVIGLFANLFRRARERRHEKMFERAIVETVKADWPGAQIA